MNQKIAVSVVYVAALFMNILDVTIVNTALPTIGREFSVRPAALDEVVIGYLVSLAVFIPASGWLGDRFGPRRVLLIAVALFTAASALCGTASSLGQLVIYRVLQGIGGGLLVPVGMALLFRTFPPAERIRASSILTIPTTLAPALGPVLGGVLVTAASWRWVFYVNVPLGVAAIAFGVAFLREPEPVPAGRFDGVGFVLAGSGLAALMFGVSEGPNRGWASGSILLALAAGAVLLAALITQQLRTSQPLLALRLYTDRLFRTANLVSLLSTAAFLGTLYLVALYFQYGLGLSALGSGLSTFPEAFGVMAGAQLAGRVLYPRLGPRRLMVGGLIGVAAMTGGLSQLGVGTTLWAARALLFGLGVAQAHVFVPAQAAAFATVSGADTGRASTLFNTQRQLGSALGVALLSTVLAAASGPLRHAISGVAGSGGRSVAGYSEAFLAAAALAVLGAVVATRVIDADAAATITGPRTRRRDRGEPGAGDPAPERDAALA